MLHGSPAFRRHLQQDSDPDRSLAHNDGSAKDEGEGSRERWPRRAFPEPLPRGYRTLSGAGVMPRSASTS
jgi:hypothetical protein